MVQLLDTMKYSTLKKTDDGSFYASISTDEDKPVVVQLNDVKLSEGELSGDDDVWFNKEDDNCIVAKEQEILEDIKADPERWFKRKVRDKTIESSFLTNVSQDGQFRLVKSPGLRVFDKSTKDVFEGEIGSDFSCDIIVQLQGITFFKRSFQVVLKLHQVQVAPPVVEEICHDNWTMEEYAFAQ